MNDLQIIIIILFNPLFALGFYTLGRKYVEKNSSTKLPIIPRSLLYYEDEGNVENYRRQHIIWILSIILAIFCTAMLLGIISGRIYIPS